MKNVKQILEYVLVLFNQALKHFSLLLQVRKAKFYGHFMLGGLGVCPQKIDFSLFEMDLKCFNA